MKEEHFFYVPETANLGVLPEDEVVHAVRVLRLREGDEIHLMDGRGSFFRAVITSLDKRRCEYEVKEQSVQQPCWNGHIHLAIAPTKMNERMEWLAEKATEIGFDELSFLDCRYSERRIIKTERIERIVVAAMKQSRKAWKPQVNEMVAFEKFIMQPRAGRKYIAHCYEEVERKYLYDELMKGVSNAQDEPLTVLIGPEGDFSLDEVRLAMDNGYESISLGSSRLRTETAGLAAVMMMQLVQSKS